MGSWSLGSVASAVMDFVPDVPTAISGTRLLELADRQRNFVESYTGTAIGSNSITITHQNIIVLLTASTVVKSMMLTGVDAGNIKLGDFSISKGKGDNLSVAAQNFEQEAMEQLKLLGKKVTSYQAYYG